MPRTRRTANDVFTESVVADPTFRADLFRFVDVLPACRDDDDVFDHLVEYLGGHGPWLSRSGLSTADRLPGGRKLAVKFARAQVLAMARRFIVAPTADEAVSALRRTWLDGHACTVDLLGEKTLTDDDALHYANRVLEMLEALAHSSSQWPARPLLEHDQHGPLGIVHLSVKPTALAPHLHSTTLDVGINEAVSMLRPIIDRARMLDATIALDMEQFDVRDGVVELVSRLWRENPGVRLGAVVQAYTRDAEATVEHYGQLGAELRDLHALSFRPLQVRLVKGAYWDAETAESVAAGWPSPLWREKPHTDASYESCTRLLLDQTSVLRPAFASHNLRSLGVALAEADARGLERVAYEIQVLRGMGESIAVAASRCGIRTRIYSPVGELVPGMGYLVRRLLENTSNSSFVRLNRSASADLDSLTEPPQPPPELAPEPLTDEPHAVATRRTPKAPFDSDGFSNAVPLEMRAQADRRQLELAVEALLGRLPLTEPAVINGERVMTEDVIESHDPGDSQRLVGVSASASTGQAAHAVAVASGARRSWQGVGFDGRAALLDRWADVMAEQRDSLAALIAVEAGKPLPEADLEVCEAIDFCRYYAIHARKLGVGASVLSVPGERNSMMYQPRGVAAVISPWNFPLAIPTGMSAAALVCGNPTILKPAEQTPLLGAQIVRMAHEAGIPPDVFGYLPGRGETVGAALVSSPDVAVIAFTGSREVGVSILRSAAEVAAGQDHIKRVVAELGGKNPVIVTTDADVEVAVPAIVASAFGYAGQKCSAASRLIVLDAVADEFIARLVGAAAIVPVGHPREIGNACGPLIDSDAVKRHARAVDEAERVGTVHLRREDVPQSGNFVGPSIVEVPTTSWVWRDEVFTPLLAVARARSIDEAFELANATPYALTGGIFTRSPSVVARAARDLRAGNVYINRTTTGAVVGRQPFGGYGLSGAGSKAGGPDYLLQFVDPRVVSENTMRQGFAPELLDP